MWKKRFINRTIASWESIRASSSVLRSTLDFWNNDKIRCYTWPPQSKQLLKSLTKKKILKVTNLASTKNPPRLSHSAWAPAHVSTLYVKYVGEIFWQYIGLPPTCPPYKWNMLVKYFDNILGSCPGVHLIYVKYVDEIFWQYIWLLPQVGSEKCWWN